MINSVDQYEFVTGANIDADHPHGDLDRILINGEIMPLRSEGHKRDLRGEDIAFLAEAVNERRKSLGYPKNTYNFSRNITSSNLIPEIDSEILGLTGTGRWIKDGVVFSEGFENPFTEDVFYNSGDYNRIEYPLFALRRKNIETMFNGVEKLHSGYFSVYASDSYLPSNWTFDIQSRGQYDPEEPSSQSMVLYDQKFSRNEDATATTETWYTYEDYEIQATSANVIFDKQYFSGYFNFDFFKSVDLWVKFSLYGVVYDYGQFSQYSGDYWKKFNLNLETLTVDLSSVTPMVPELLRSIGYTPSRQEVNRSYSEYGGCQLLSAPIFHLVGELRDRTRW